MKTTSRTHGRKGSLPASRTPSGGVRAAAIYKRLTKRYAGATTALHYSSPLELLIATILSAQCTDERVNIVTKTLFIRYRSAAEFAHADRGELEEIIRSTGFFRAKAKSIINCCTMLMEHYGGEVPPSMSQLTTLPGVGRKTANVVLGTAYGIPSGIVVDTHVQRIANRLDLTRNEDPKKIEQDLMQVIPKDRWILFSHQIIWHGRRICQARKPKCAECNLESLCYAKDKTI